MKDGKATVLPSTVEEAIVVLAAERHTAISTRGVSGVNLFTTAESIKTLVERVTKERNERVEKQWAENDELEATDKKRIADSEVEYNLKEGDPVYFIPGVEALCAVYSDEVNPDDEDEDEDWFVEKAYLDCVTPEPFVSGVLEGDHYIHAHEIDTETIKDRIDILPAPIDYGWTYFAPFKANPKVQVMGMSHEDIYVRAAVVQAALDRHQRKTQDG